MLLRIVDQLHARRDARAFTWLTRILLAIAFLPSGLVKLQGERFTRIGIEHPVGFFFEAFYRTGFYWNFLGAAQLIAALLIVVPRTRVIGALVYFPIILNIFLITWSMHFKGTWVITLLMLLGSVWLLLWDARTLQHVVASPIEGRREAEAASVE